MSTHLVTGATGFIGGALVLELLRDEAAEVHCLVRGEDAEGAECRLFDALRLGARLYDEVDLLASGEGRIRAVAGDVRAPLCGVEGALPERVDEVWHCAASLQFTDREREEIEATNVIGMNNVLELARRLQTSGFSYMSTAYVAGKRSGEIREEIFTDVKMGHNPYEESKIRAETAVARVDDFHTRVLRPSVVIGHGETYGAATAAGVYGFLRGLFRLKREVTERLGGFMAFRPLRIRADGAVRLNVVTVDAVVRSAVEIVRSGSPERVFHLTNHRSPRVDQITRAMAREIGLSPPVFVTDKSEFTLIDERFDEDERTEFFRHYMSSPKRFDTTNLVSAVGYEACTTELNEEILQPYIHWYAELLDRATAGRRGGERFGMWRVEA